MSGRTHTLGLYAPRTEDALETATASARFERRSPPARDRAHDTRYHADRAQIARRASEVKLLATEPGIHVVGAAALADVLGNRALAYWIAVEMASGQVALSRSGQPVAWFPAHVRVGSLGAREQFSTSQR